MHVITRTNNEVKIYVLSTYTRAQMYALEGATCTRSVSAVLTTSHCTLSVTARRNQSGEAIFNSDVLKQLYVPY